jgi:hypothetical protein
MYFLWLKAMYASDGNSEVKKQPEDLNIGILTFQSQVGRR